MRAMMRALLACSLLALIGGSAAAAQTIKVGVLAPLSGPFAEWGTQFRQGVETYVAQHGTSVDGHRVEFIWRDLTRPNPPRAKALAQELVVKDRVDYLAGFVFTPNAIAVAPLIQQAGVPTVLFNAATSIITEKSANFVRTSFTLAQVSTPAAEYALGQGIKTMVTMVTDYGPGIDAQKAFKKIFEAGGGKVLDEIRMPLQTTDYGPFMQRAASLHPDAIFAFTPGGPPTYSFVKAYVDNGLQQDGIRYLATQESTQELVLQSLGAQALGFETSGNYSAAHDSDVNRAFLEALHKIHPDAIANFATVGAYDGTHVLYAMIHATGGKRDAKKAVDAVRGMQWESPRGPVKIDPDYRSVIQNIYIRKVEKRASGKLYNKEIKTYPMQPDFGLTGTQ